MQGQPFSYQIAASGSPTSFAATGLPAGLSLSTTSGVITGSPQIAGTFTAVISASNAQGTGSANLNIVISTAAPVIALSTHTLEFPEIGVGQIKDLEIVVSNSGSGTLTGTATAPAPFTVVSGSPYSVAPGQTRSVILRFAPGTSGLFGAQASFTGGGNSVASLSGQAYPVFTSSSFASTAGLLSDPFVPADNAISQPIDTVGDPVSTGAGRAVYGFTVPVAGDYVISAMVNASSDAANSVYVNVDAEPVDPLMIWDIPVVNGFVSQTVAWRGNGSSGTSEFSPKVFTLSGGVHKLVICGREGNTALSQITVTAVETAPIPPQNLRIVVN